MNPEQQQLTIAEACGYKTGYRDPEAWHPLPDFLNDLNAMHEAEETLQESQRVTYSNELYDLAVEHQLKTGKWSYLSMTAAQRAEAFLRTIGKWEEAK
jgi:hypothetical protein